MGRACGMHGRGGNVCRLLVGRPEEKRRHLEDLGIDGSIVLG